MPELPYSGDVPSSELCYYHFWYRVHDEFLPDYEGGIPENRAPVGDEVPDITKKRRARKFEYR